MRSKFRLPLLLALVSCAGPSDEPECSRLLSRIPGVSFTSLVEQEYFAEIDKLFPGDSITAPRTALIDRPDGVPEKQVFLRRLDQIRPPRALRDCGLHVPHVARYAFCYSQGIEGTFFVELKPEAPAPGEGLTSRGFEDKGKAGNYRVFQRGAGTNASIIAAFHDVFLFVGDPDLVKRAIQLPQDGTGSLGQVRGVPDLLARAPRSGLTFVFRNPPGLNSEGREEYDYYAAVTSVGHPSPAGKVPFSLSFSLARNEAGRRTLEQMKTNYERLRGAPQSIFTSFEASDDVLVVRGEEDLKSFLSQ